MGFRRVRRVAFALVAAVLLSGSLDASGPTTAHLRVKGEVVPIHYLPPREFKQAFAGYPELSAELWYADFARGFTVHGHIFLRDGPVADEPRLIAHELGHILGYEHTLELTTMNPWGPFRWSDPEGLVPLVEAGYEPPPLGPLRPELPDLPSLLPDHATGGLWRAAA